MERSVEAVLVAGRVGLLVVPLPAGATVPLGDCCVEFVGSGPAGVDVGVGVGANTFATGASNSRMILMVGTASSATMAVSGWCWRSAMVGFLCCWWMGSGCRRRVRRGRCRGGGIAARPVSGSARSIWSSGRRPPLRDGPDVVERHGCVSPDQRLGGLEGALTPPAGSRRTARPAHRPSRRTR